MTLHELKNSKAIALACIIFVLLVLAACGPGGGDVEPHLPPPAQYSYSPPADRADGWMTAGAGSLGMSEEGLEDMMNSMTADFDIVDSIAIAHQGQLVLNETLRTG